jgi:hypothetical protein
MAATTGDRFMLRNIKAKIVPEILTGGFRRALCFRIFSCRSENSVLLLTDSSDSSRLADKRGDFFQAFSRLKLIFSGSSKMLTRSLNVLDF